ncbi:DNA polymerase III subunit alpha, partial [Streptomyces sp. B1866]|uniref:helix-hairpin-helix domain-containing protein n=1 Tax=Streptomyces sp. B1866 TaxID=3075431 RepID=UPI002891A166
REAAAACRLDPVAGLGMGRPHFPEPGLVGAGDGRAAAGRVLRQRCEAGLARRGLAGSPAARARLAAELDMIERLRYPVYFLTVEQVVADARERGIRVAARGSAVGSMVCYTLGISDVDPLEHGLVFERFLSPMRRGLPDIDVDTESARRLEVYRAVLERFGPDRVATVAMPETYRARGAIREVGAALSMDPGEIDWLATSFPHIRASEVRAALAELPELRPVAARAGRHDLLWDLVEELDGVVHGVAMHPCGVIISDLGLRDRLPVVPTAGEGFPMAQADKDDSEAFGLLKLDVLGVRLWSAMAHATAEIQRATGERIDLEDPAQVPLDDPAAFELIRRGDTIGMFQLESPGQRDLLTRLRPATVHDIVADISLFRPGPVRSDMPGQYIAARHGRPPRLPHRDLEPVLRDSHGVVIWHEQVGGIIDALTACGPALAEEARRALADEARQGAVRDWFHRAAAARGYAQEVRDRVWEVLKAFAAYGFCRAHATAFTTVALRSAWLKAHRAAALYAGVLEHDPGMWPRRLIVADARRHGVPILPVDVNRSDTAYRIELECEKWGVRIPLTQVHGITAEEAARIAAGQPYTGLSDFWHRARPALPTAQRLATVGALAPLAAGAGRRDLLLHLAELHRSRRAAGTGQLPLPGPAGPGTGEPAGLPDLTEPERVGAELDVLGIDASRHLMDSHRGLLADLGVTPADRLAAVRHGTPVLVAGIRAATQTPPIASGRRIIFVTLDDGTGLVDLAFFEDSHPACAHTVFHSGLLLVRGVLQRRGRPHASVSVTGTTAWDLAELAGLHDTGGLTAVAARLAGPARDEAGGPAPAGGPDIGDRDGGDPDGGDPDGGGPDGPPRRPAAVRLPTGYQMHPWADLQPAGRRTPAAGRLWHASPGSAG